MSAKLTCKECACELGADHSECIQEAVILPCADEPESDVVAASERELRAMTDLQLRAIGLTPAQRDRMLRGEIINGILCICQQCQARILGEGAIQCLM